MALDLLIDMDGVCANLNRHLCALIEHDFDVVVSPDDIKNYDLSMSFPTVPKKSLYAYFHRAEFWSSLRPIEGAIEVITALHQEGHDIKFVTSCPGGHDGKIKWLKKHFDFIRKKPSPWYDVIFTAHKHLVRGHLLLDDLPANVDKFCQEQQWHPDVQAGVLFRQPYNLEYSGLSVSTWVEFHGIVQAVDKLRQAA